MTGSSGFKKGQKVTVTRKNGSTAPAEFVEKGAAGSRGSFDVVKLSDGQILKARPSQIAAA